MVTRTGKIIPSASFCVLALNCLQKSIMFTPCGPSAVPTGGAGVDLPGGNCSLVFVCTFFGGIVPYLNYFIGSGISPEALTQAFRRSQNPVPLAWSARKS